MLVLTRKAGQRLLIGDNIRITVLDCQNGRIKIGIEAPPDVMILREELRADATRRVTPYDKPTVKVTR
jgi:carbon storage regulator